MVAITGWTVDSWPFSMVKFLDHYTIIFYHNALRIYAFEAYCDSSDVWDATIISGILSTQTLGYPTNIDIADFGWFYALSYVSIQSSVLDVKCYVREPGIASSTDAIRALPTDSCPEFVTCCNFKGQAIIGGIISTADEWTQLGKCSVAWSAIGQFEFRPLKNRTAGFVRMPWSDWDEGMVYKVARLGDVVIAYGNGGRAGLRPYSGKLATGFGLVDTINGPGLSKGFHMAGDNSIHTYVDTNNELWIAETGPKFTKLGYKEWFTDLLAENEAEATGMPMVVSYDPTNKRFYFGGFSSSYVLTEWGLYSTEQSCSGIGNYRGNVLCGFFKDLSDPEGRFKVADMDFGQRGLKTLDHVELGIDYAPSGSEYVNTGVDIRYDHAEDYRVGDWGRVNKHGIGYLGKTASDFRVKGRVTDYTDGDPKIDSLKVRLKVVDKRSIRGMYDADIKR